MKGECSDARKRILAKTFHDAAISAADIQIHGEWRTGCLARQSEFTAAARETQDRKILQSTCELAPELSRQRVSSPPELWHQSVNSHLDPAPTHQLPTLIPSQRVDSPP